jgi:hypothetical protein
MHVFIAAVGMSWHQFVLSRPNLKHAVLIWRHRDSATAAALIASADVALKIHHPCGELVGVSRHEGYGEAPLSRLWSIYGEQCGASSWEELRRTTLYADEDDAVVGFVRLRDLAFLPAGHRLGVSVDIEDVAVPVTDEPDSPVRELVDWYRSNPPLRHSRAARRGNTHFSIRMRHRMQPEH